MIAGAIGIKGWWPALFIVAGLGGLGLVTICKNDNDGTATFYDFDWPIVPHNAFACWPF